MERFIHRTLVAYIVFSPLIIGSMAYVIYSQSVQIKEAQTELAWKGLEMRMAAPAK